MKRQYWNIFPLFFLVLCGCSKEKTEFEIICDNLCGTYRLESSGLGTTMDLDGNGIGFSTIEELEGLPGGRNEWLFAQIIKDTEHPNTLIFVAQIHNVVTSLAEDGADIQVRYETVVEYVTLEATTEGKMEMPLFFGAKDPILAPNTYGLYNVAFTDIDLNRHSFTIRGQNSLYDRDSKKLHDCLLSWCKYVRM